MEEELEAAARERRCITATRKPPLCKLPMHPSVQIDAALFCAAASKLTGDAIHLYQQPNEGGLRSADHIMPRVLVVDDDPMVCMAIETYLQRNGFEVTVADDGEAGLRALEASTFDVLLIDIFMPHMRGFESIRIFHERAPATPLIAMSGYAFANFDMPSPDFLRMTLELGATVCLRKPFKPDALLAAVNQCLGKPPASTPDSK